MLLDSIPIVKAVAQDGAAAAGDRPDLVGSRDRALIGLMAYSFARVGAVLQMKVVFDHLHLSLADLLLVGAVFCQPCFFHFYFRTATRVSRLADSNRAQWRKQSR